MRIEVTSHSKWRSAAAQVHPRCSCFSIPSGRVCRRITIWQSGLSHLMIPRHVRLDFFPPSTVFDKVSPFLSPPCRHIAQWTWSPWVASTSACVNKRSKVPSGHPSHSSVWSSFLSRAGCFDCRFEEVALPIGRFDMGTSVPLASRMHWTIWALVPTDEVAWIIPDWAVAV